MTPPIPDAASASALRPARLAVEVAPAVLLFALLLWGVKEILSPILLFPLLCVVLWPQRSNRTVARLLVTTGALTTVWFLYVTGALLAPFILALAIAYFLAPLVAAVERRRVPRWLAIVLVLLPFLATLALLLVLLVPAVENQLTQLAGQLPSLIRRIADWLLGLRTRFLATSGGILSPEQAQRLRDLEPADLVGMVNASWEAIGRRIWAALLGVGKGVGVALTILGYVIIAPVVTFYLLKSWPRFTAMLGELVPPAGRAGLFGFLAEYDRLLGRYVRGQLTEAALVAVLTGGALALLAFPGALLVGVIAGIGNLVPYIGLPLSIIPGVLFALVSGAVWPSLLKLVIVFGVVQFVDGSITGPRIVGGSVGLDPVWVMIALALFGSLLGFVGLLVAVPLAVLVKLLATRAIERYRQSAIYTGAVTG
ncbi:MAG: AI-2E family transporter [Gemmatimonadetes bacterium]|nr:AI-2E family transporter [Gemmatimonadota bacterium]